VTGIVSDIQRFSLHDGPGIRTTVFLKGCSMRCRWCHNPETLRRRPELRVQLDKCIGCGQCVRVCPRHAHVATAGRREFRRELCTTCGRCAEECYAGALTLVGREMTPAAVLDEVIRDMPFYVESGGGVTFSGGEPTEQCQFTCEILRLCRNEGIHTAVETNLAGPWEDFCAALPLLDLVMMDIKMTDPARHRQWTGVDNRRILDNARRLGRGTKPLIVRTPVITGVNDCPEEIGAIARFVRDFDNLVYYELLPYHPLGVGKYRSLGMDPPPATLEVPTDENMRKLAEVARREGIEVRTPVDGRR